MKEFRYKYRHQRQRKRLYDENPYCPDCDVEMILPEDIGFDEKGRQLSYPDNLCTIDHKYTRYQPEKRKNPGYSSRTICCTKCNIQRAKKVELLIGKDQIREKSGSFPLIIMGKRIIN